MSKKNMEALKERILDEVKGNLEEDCSLEENHWLSDYAQEYYYGIILGYCECKGLTQKEYNYLFNFISIGKDSKEVKKVKKNFNKKRSKILNNIAKDYRLGGRK